MSHSNLFCLLISEFACVHVAYEQSLVINVNPVEINCAETVITKFDAKMFDTQQVCEQ